MRQIVKLFFESSREENCAKIGLVRNEILAELNVIHSGASLAGLGPNLNLRLTVSENKTSDKLSNVLIRFLNCFINWLKLFFKLFITCL